MDKDNYKVRYCANFPTTTNPSVYYYNIPNNATNVVQAKAEAIHESKIADYQLFAVAERETRDFIPAVVEDTWFRELCEPVMLYIAVSPSEPMAHLQYLSGGIHALDVLALQNEMQHYHQDMEGILE